MDSNLLVLLSLWISPLKKIPNHIQQKEWVEYSKTIQLLPLVLCSLVFVPWSLNFINQETPAVVTARV
ncbi:hypothetical protein, partial [Pedobacter sp. GR22-10]|uniref:hypothetical protein n=1 Tax=Pedobacter sp. GR22-10 TaxID=2994472 RepID=UPI002247160A